ncbi:hypothetical protein A5821_003002 [Enterococcus sp. 7F3_DIV0205]|uniref:Lipoprotein n=1 Tax=Candidatus Enterococcus palustris TaxID=1834189 RepID=A0AAQ3Y675_9ENTE|nr:hypothetical protein [Enterococcus sp. 7F3_DIV0205]OTN83436.1 hypothetical protein A5821_003359 [Enterococcus sp. 7F3_DIV0205]
MSQKKRSMSLMILVLLLVLIGCGKTDRYAGFSQAEHALSWSSERNRSFGDADYSKIEKEAKAFDLLQDKYNVTVSNYYETTKHTLTKELTSKTVKLGAVQYAIFARNKELEFRTLYPFYRGEELQVFSEVILTYAYSVDQAQTYLKSQIVTVKIAPIKGTLPNDNQRELITAIGKNMKLPEKKLETGLAGYEKRMKESENPITDDYLPIVSNTSGLDKEQEFLKEIAAVYDEVGTFRELYAEISDQKSK